MEIVLGKNKTKISIEILENLIPMGPGKRLINPRLSVWSRKVMDVPQTPEGPGCFSKP